ncbi:MAG: hypothetical protein AAF556_13420, partial [Pseudomonadota bacterium]
AWVAGYRAPAIAQAQPSRVRSADRPDAYAGTSPSTYADTYTVGPGGMVETMSLAGRRARNNDTLLLLPGVYRECAVLNAQGLTVRAPNHHRSAQCDLRRRHL